MAFANPWLSNLLSFRFCSSSQYSTRSSDKEISVNEQGQEDQLWYAYDSIDTWLTAAIELGTKTRDLNHVLWADNRRTREAAFDDRTLGGLSMKLD